MRMRKAKLHHVQMERRVAARVSGAPFLCSLAYAFQTGPLLVLVLPLFPGGTLQVLPCHLATVLSCCSCCSCCSCYRATVLPCHRATVLQLTPQLCSPSSALPLSCH